MKDVDRALVALAEKHHHLVDLAVVRRSGMTARQWQRRVANGEWVAVQSGVWRHVATPLTWELRVRAASMRLGRDAAAAGTTAARWWGLDGFECIDDVTFLVPRSRRSVSGVTTHTVVDWDPADLLHSDGVRLTNVTRTVLDLAAHGVSVRSIERAVDSGVRLRFTSVPRIRRRLGELSGSGHRGVRLMRELLLDSGGESDLERRFLGLMRRSGLPRPSMQVAFTRESGRAMRVDFLFSAANLVVEVSGRLGHSSDRDRQNDVRRRNALTGRGVAVREFTTIDVIDDPGYVVAEVRAVLGSFMSL